MMKQLKLKIIDWFDFLFLIFILLPAVFVISKCMGETNPFDD